MTISDLKKSFSTANVQHSPFAHQWMYALERAPETIEEVLEKDPKNEVHLHSIIQFQDGWEWELGLCELFDIHEPDPELSRALAAALLEFSEQIHNPHATVCGLLLCAFRAFLKNHSDFDRYEIPTLH